MSRLDNFEEILNSYEGREPANHNFSIKTFGSFYRISGIKYRGEFISCDFDKAVLRRRTQDEYASLAWAAKAAEVRIACAPLVYAICRTLYQNQDCENLVENARQCIENMLDSGIITLSRAVHKDRGSIVFHDYAQKTQYVINANLLGPDGKITDMQTDNAKEYCQAVLNTVDSVEEINAVFNWLTGRDAYASRIGSEPDLESGRVIALRLGNAGLMIDSSLGLQTVVVAMGVRQVQDDE